MGALARGRRGVTDLRRRGPWTRVGGAHVRGADSGCRTTGDGRMPECSQRIRRHRLPAHREPARPGLPAGWRKPGAGRSSPPRRPGRLRAAGAARARSRSPTTTETAPHSRLPPPRLRPPRPPARIPTSPTAGSPGARTGYARRQPTGCPRAAGRVEYRSAPRKPGRHRAASPARAVLTAAAPTATLRKRRPSLPQAARPTGSGPFDALRSAGSIRGSSAVARLCAPRTPGHPSPRRTGVHGASQGRMWQLGHLAGDNSPNHRVSRGGKHGPSSVTGP